MIIEVRVVPNARRNSVADWNGKVFVHLTASAEGGRANTQLVEVLSEHFDVKRSAVKIVRGVKSRDKVVEILK
ncbi:MAG TPA: DUF167 domain-containing protein [archaeon]|nr:DUF167 domain-containing protein [archaeon]